VRVCVGGFGCFGVCVLAFGCVVCFAGTCERAEGARVRMILDYLRDGF